MPKPQPRVFQSPEASAEESHAPRRHDPATRAYDYAFDRTALRNKDPKKWYQFVDPNGRLDNVSTFKARGWTVECKTPGGVCLGLETEVVDEGEPIQLIGQVLMSCSLEEHQRINRQGLYGNTGWEYYDQVDKKLLKKGGYDDVVSNRYAEVVNETTPRRVTYGE